MALALAPAAWLPGSLVGWQTWLLDWMFWLFGLLIESVLDGLVVHLPGVLITWVLFCNVSCPLYPLQLALHTFVELIFVCVCFRQLWILCARNDEVSLPDQLLPVLLSTALRPTPTIHLSVRRCVDVSFAPNAAVNMYEPLLYSSVGVTVA